MDIAALNPLLRISGDKNYYKECQALRNEVKKKLLPFVGDGHELYILSSTTHCLLVLMSYLACANNLIDTKNGVYPGYNFIKNKITNDRKWHLVTHICPLSGNVADQDELQGEGNIIDGAQSFCTAVHHEYLIRTNIYFAPFHKHFGVQIGLAVLAISHKANNRTLHEVAKSAENSSFNIKVLIEALDRLEDVSSRFYNCAVINTNQTIINLALSLDTEIITTPNSQGPFVSIKGPLAESGADEFINSGFETKYFAKQGVLRISKYHPGEYGDKVDYSNKFLETLKTLVKSNG